MQCSNLEAQLEHGGPSTSPPYMLITMFHGVNSIPPFMHITYLLKEFLDLEKVNHSVFNYMRQFNTLAQYRSYHVDTDGKKANLYRVGLTIHLQERLVQLVRLSYNELASAAIDQERIMKDVAQANEKKRKRMMPGSAGSGSSSGPPPKYRMVYTPPRGHLRQPQQHQNWHNRPQFQ
jgi:hypothetical protein